MSKPAKVNFRLIERAQDLEESRSIYKLLDSLIEAHHDHLDSRRVAVAWRFGWIADPDGRLVLGQCKKASDLDRELHDFDFVILLNWDFWSSSEVTEEQRAALMDHELCHASEKLDGDLEPVFDIRGRKKFRIRKHDIEEFRCIVDRHGLYKSDLQAFAEAIKSAQENPLFADQQRDQAIDNTTVEISANGGTPVKTTIKKMREATSRIGGRPRRAPRGGVRA